MPLFPDGVCFGIKCCFFYRFCDRPSVLVDMNKGSKKKTIETQQALQEKIVQILLRLGWEQWAIGSWKSKVLKHKGITAKVRFTTLSFQSAPYCIIAIPEDFKLPAFTDFYQRYLDMDETLRLVLDFFQGLSTHSLLLLHDAHTSFVYTQPEEVLLGHSDSLPSFHERILALLRPELAFSPDTVIDMHHQRLFKLSKEFQQWFRLWSRKLESVADLQKISIQRFLHKVVLWRLATYTQANDTAKATLQRYHFSESRFRSKKVRLPAAGKDIALVFSSLSEENLIPYFKLTPEDVLLIRRTQNAKLLVRLLWEINLLSRCKCSPSIIANHLDLEQKNTSRAPGKRSALKDRVKSATGRKKKNYILELPSPRHIELDTKDNFTTLVKEMNTAFQSLLSFRSDVMSQSKKSRERLFIQEDLFLHDQRPMCDYKDLLKLLVSNGVKIIARDDTLRRDALFVVTAWLMTTQRAFNLPASSFPALHTIFTD